MIMITTGHVVAVNVSAGGIPKRPLPAGTIRKSGLEGDGHAHVKHNRSDRALSLFDTEIMQDLLTEGFPITPGVMGENLALEGLLVQRLPPGTLLRIGEAVVRLEQPRKPCYVLDAIDPRLKDNCIGRCGFMASVVEEGTVRPGDVVQVLDC